MRVLAVVIAGGGSRRFGGDKAGAMLSGRTLLDHALDAMAAQADAVVVSGHASDGFATLADRPAGVGPLGGLAAALDHAARQGFDGVLCVPVDVHPLPRDLVERLGGEGAAVFADQHMIGWWPSRSGPGLDRFIAEGGRAVHDWIDAAGARRVADPPGLVNINTPGDLERLTRSR